MKNVLKFAFAFIALSTGVSEAQYPTRPIKFVMAYPPAGSSDVLARPIANEMTKGLGQPVLLEYKPGAGSTIAADFVAKSPPDGYTIVLLLTAHAVNATLMPKLPYDTVKDFTPITLAAVAPLVVEVHADSPIRTLRDLITMGPGEVAEFDTRMPHWFGPVGDDPVEILSVHGSHGERMHVGADPERVGLPVGVRANHGLRFVAVQVDGPA
jgi:hypothetical protein